MKVLGSIIVCCCVFSYCLGQGSPLLRNYLPEEYAGFRQNWAVTQAPSGKIIIGNGAAVLIFDGNKWQEVPLPNLETTRSLLTASDGTIYYGGYNDFGYLKPDSLHRYSAISISDSVLQTHGNFNDVWYVKEHAGNIYFQTRNVIYVFDGEEIHAIASGATLNGLFHFNGDLVTLQDKTGLSKITGNQLEKIEGTEAFADDRLYGIEKFEDRWIFIFRNNGLVSYDGRFKLLEGEASRAVNTLAGYKSQKINEDELAIATLSGGIIIADKYGAITNSINENDGLNTNVTYNVYLDAEKNLWIATDNGISQFNVNSRLSKLDSRNGLKGIVTGIAVLDEFTFVGTTEGLYKVDSGWEPHAVVHGDGAINRVYNLLKSGNNIYVLTPSGIYITQNGGVAKWSDAVVYNGYAVPNTATVLFFDSNNIYLINDDAPQLDEPFYTHENTIQYVIVFKGDIWILDYNSKIHRIDFSGKLKEVYSTEISDNNRINILAHADSILWAGATYGLFYFDESEAAFKPDHRFSDEGIKQNQISIIETCDTGNLWFRANRTIKKAWFEQNRWNVSSTPYQQIGQGEAIYAISCVEDNILFGGTEGIYILNTNEWKYGSYYESKITGVYIRNDSLIYGGYGELPKPLVLPYQDNELRFTYAAASYISPENTLYQFKLDGFDSGWSNWTSERQKDYTNIPEGEYIFQVRSKNIFETEGAVDSFRFSVLPPWYRTWWAYLMYTLAISVILYTAYRIRVNQLLKVERIRNKIATDLHDEVSATLSSISYFAQAVKTGRVKENNKFIDLILESAVDAKEKISDIVWSINPEHDNWAMFLSKCNRYAADLFESKNIKYSLKIDTDIPLSLDMQLRQHLWLIFKEMITNAARHAEAKHVDVILNYTDNALRLVVQDNGNGMDVDKVKKGNGLVNIQKRAELIKANISLTTEIGFGTRWALKIPL